MHFKTSDTVHLRIRATGHIVCFITLGYPTGGGGIEMGVYRRSRVHRANREVHRAARTRARTKDLDQIHQDLKPENLNKLQAAMAEFDPDLPGGGQFPCVPCRYLVGVYVNMLMILVVTLPTRILLISTWYPNFTRSA